MSKDKEVWVVTWFYDDSDRELPDEESVVKAVYDNYKAAADHYNSLPTYVDRYRITLSRSVVRSSYVSE